MRVRVSAKSDDDALFVGPHHGGSDTGLGTAEEPLCIVDINKREMMSTTRTSLSLCDLHLQYECYILLIKA